ncbi:MAG TPA: hypothetical protein VF738_05750, partial [Rhodanobacter sp.]
PDSTNPIIVPMVIGVTSHRNLAAGEIEPIRQRVRSFFARLRREYPGLPLLLLSALAEGGDQLVAQEALAAGARLLAPLPLPRELYEDDFIDPAARAGFDALCARAEVVELPLHADQPLHEVGSPGTARDRRYAQAGVYIASHCHILLAIWDGKPSHRIGGTAQIVGYHLSGTLPGHLSRRQRARHALGTGDERLLYHIVCSRDAADGTPAAGLQPLQTLWRSADTAVAKDPDKPAEFQRMFAHMTEFNADCAKYAAAIEASATVAQGTGPGAATSVDRLFHAADWLAIHFQRRVLLALRSTYTLAALMGIAFACYAHLPGQNYLIYLFLLLFALGALVAVIARRREWHRKYLDYRALAEGLRIQSYWRRANISMSGEHEFAHDNFLQRQNVELGWIRNVMRVCALHPPAAPAASTEAELASVIAEWVGESGKSGQLHYYEHKTAEHAGLHRVTETIGSVSLWGGIAISVFLAVFVFRLADTQKTVLVTAMAVLSIVAAVREAYAYRKADKELIKQYRFMQRIFASARAALDRTHDPEEQREILLSLGDAALTEHAEWTLMQRERQVEQGKL